MLASNWSRRSYSFLCACGLVSLLALSYFSHLRYYRPGTNGEGVAPIKGFLISEEQSLGASSGSHSKPKASQAFPKKIWQAWKDDSDNPTERTVGFPHQWRVTNPAHRYERITDDNADSYVRENFSTVISALFTSMTDQILRADFLRYLVMLREGGIWADIDVLPHQPVSVWVPEQYRNSTNIVVGIENDHHKRPIWNGVPYSVQLAQYTMLAKPNHPVFATLVDQVSTSIQALLESKGPDDYITFEDVMSTTGPFIFTKVLMEYFSETTGISHNGDELTGLTEPKLIGDVLVLPKDSFGWLSHEHTHPKGDPNILVEHLFIGSWREGHPG